MENTTFPCKTTLSKVNVKTSRIGDGEEGWGWVQNESTTNLSFIYGCVFPVGILKSDTDIGKIV